MAAQTILDRSVAMRVLPSAIFTADTFAKIPILQKPIGHVVALSSGNQQHRGAITELWPFHPSAIRRRLWLAALKCCPRCMVAIDADAFDLFKACKKIRFTSRILSEIWKRPGGLVAMAKPQG